MYTLLTIIHVIVSVLLCLVILLQSGRGGGMGAAFGGATSQIFGGRGAGNFLSRITSVSAIVFFVTSLALTMMSSRQQSVVRTQAKKAAAESTPAPADTTEAPAPAEAAAATAPAPEANAPPAAQAPVPTPEKTAQ